MGGKKGYPTPPGVKESGFLDPPSSSWFKRNPLGHSQTPGVQYQLNQRFSAEKKLYYDSSVAGEGEKTGWGESGNWLQVIDCEGVKNIFQPCDWLFAGRAFSRQNAKALRRGD